MANENTTETKVFEPASKRIKDLILTGHNEADVFKEVGKILDEQQEEINSIRGFLNF